MEIVIDSVVATGELVRKSRDGQWVFVLRDGKGRRMGELRLAAKRFRKLEQRPHSRNAAPVSECKDLTDDEVAELLAAAAGSMDNSKEFKEAYRQLVPMIRPNAVGVYCRFNSGVSRRSADLNDFADEATADVIQAYGRTKAGLHPWANGEWRKWVRSVLRNKLVDAFRRSRQLERLVDFWNGAGEEVLRKKYKMRSQEAYEKWMQRALRRPGVAGLDQRFDAAEDFREHMELVKQALVTTNPLHAMVILCEYDLGRWLGREFAERIAIAASRRLSDTEAMDRRGVEQYLGVGADNWYQITSRFRRAMKKDGERLAA